MDRMLVKPMSSTCHQEKSMCVKTMQITKEADGTPKVLSIHRECYELDPPHGSTRGGYGCVDSYDEDDPISRRIGKAATLDNLLLFFRFMQLLNISFLFLLNLGNLCLSLRILVYSPRMIPSHVSFVANIANLLARKGHKVTIIDNILRNDISNQIDYSLMEKVVQVQQNENVSRMLASTSIPKKFWVMRNEPNEQREAMEHLGLLFLEQCKQVFSSENNQMLVDLKTMAFDFGIHEVFDTCGIGIFEKLEIRKSVILSSTGMRDIVNEALGIAGPLESSSILSDYGANIPFFGIRRNLEFHSAWRNFFKVQSKPLESLLKVDDFENLLRYSNLMLVNTHELADSQRPWSRRVHEIGGISFKTSKNLDKETLELFSNFSSVVMVSFGTTTPSFLMPDTYKNNFLKVFSKFPNVLFLWKYEKEDDFVKSYTGTNIKFLKYLPQVDLLESGRITLFITHGGQNSLLETFHANVPALVIPLFGDQHRNAQISLENGLVQVLKKGDLANKELIETAVKLALDTTIKKSNGKLQRVSSNLRNARKTSETLLINSIESIYSSSHPPNFKENPRILFNCDVILVILDTSLLIPLFFVMVIMLKKLLSLFS